MNTAEIREYFMNNRGYGHDLLESLHNDLFMTKANVEKTETIMIKGKEFIKESGTLTLSNFTDEFPAVYSALFGKLDYLYDSGKTPENDVPIAFLAVSMNSTDVMKQEMITNIDNLAKGLAMTDEAEAEKFAESLTTDQRSFFTEGASVTAPNGTRGNMRKTGPFNILQPEYWWFTKSTEFGDADDPSEIAMKSFDGSKYMYVNYYSGNYDPEKWAGEKAEFLKTQPEYYEDISAVPAFTSGNFKWGVVKYKTESVHGQPWEWSFIASGVSTDGSENCVQIKLVGLDYESNIAQDILATVDAAKGGVQ